MSTMVIPSITSIGPSRAARTAPSRSGHLRLTRRGRVVLVAAALLAVLAAGFFLGATSVASGQAGTPTPTRTVVVAPGESLWTLAAEITPEGEDVRDTMYDIKRLNALDSSALQAGQRLRIPLAR